MADIAVVPLTRFEEYLACEDLQRRAWNMDTDRDVVPAHLLRPVHEYGGIVLGAYTPHHELIGFVFGFTGRISDDEDPRPTWMGTRYLHCSEMMGILPEYRSQSIGFRLKQEQRKLAMAQGHRLMVWTFDPLLSLNARLNLGKLGGICRRYVRDAYGQLSGMYAGLPTDRFEAEWWLCSDRVRQHMNPAPGLSSPSHERSGRSRKDFSSPLQGGGGRRPEGVMDHQQSPSSLSDWLDSGAHYANPASFRTDGLPVPPDSFRLSDSSHLLVEIPADFQAVRAADMGLASAWRMHTRDLFERAFQQEYVAAWFVSEPVDGIRRSFYVLSRDLDVESLARQADCRI